MRRDLSRPEQRVLGCLIEKQRTTPDQYPLTINGLRLACNQSTNRDPVTDYDEGTVREAAQSLGHRRLARFTSGHGGRVAKYRHLMREEAGLADDELAVLCVILLRGPQTPGELKARTERLHRFAGLDEIQATIEALTARDLVVRLERRPGQKEQRYGHLLSADSAEAEPLRREPPATPVAPAVLSAVDEPRVRTAPHEAPATSTDAALEARVSALESDLRELREQLGDLIDD